jgi:hypothetical protein
MRSKNLPEGWNEKRVRAVIEHHENQMDEERGAEIDAALAAERRAGAPKKRRSNDITASPPGRSAARRSGKSRRKIR